jgi:poly(A) polymerase
MSAPARIVMPWARTPAAEQVVAALQAGGAHVRFVGGCVRDAIMGKVPSDIDIATPEPPETVIARLDAAGIKAVPTGIAHGTVTAIADHQPFEVTTLRRDVETDGRRAVVAYTDDWREDAARRDFTMNAIYADPDGTLFDPVGGQADLAAGHVRFVGNAHQRIAEDYLRVLRFFRFHARFGRGAPEPSALAACAAARDRLGRLSAERVAAELLKLLALDDPMAGLGPMVETGVLGALVPEAIEIARLEGLLRIEADLFRTDAVRRLGALLPDEEAARAVGTRLKLSNADKARLVAMHAIVPALAPDMAVRAMRRWLYSVGVQTFSDLVLLRWAADPERGHDVAWRTALAIAESWTPVRLPVKGEDLVAAGIAPGTEVGRLLDEVERWWMDQDFRPDRAACLAEIGRLASGAK